MSDTMIYDVVDYLQDSGFFDYALPFLLVFAITFGILEKTSIFGSTGTEKKPRTNINAIVAALIGLYVVTSTPVVEKIFVFIPKVGLLLLIILAFLLMIGFFMGAEPKLTGGVFIIALIFALVATAWAISSGEDLGGFESWRDLWDNYYQSIIVIGIIVIAMVGIIFSGGKSNAKSAFDNFHGLFGGGTTGRP